MNPTARTLSAAGIPAKGLAVFPWSWASRLTLPENQDERVADTAAAMTALVHHAAAIGTDVARVAETIRSPRQLWSMLKLAQRLTPDPDGVELLRSPLQSAQTIRAGNGFEGDCDDVAMLACALAIRKGWSCWFRVIRRAEEWEHVYAWVQTAECVVALPIDPQETAEPFAEREYAAHLDFPVWRA